MTARGVFLLLLIVGAVCCGVVTWAAMSGDMFASLVAAIAFGVAAVSAGAWINAGALSRGERDGQDVLVDISRTNAALLAITFGWGALSLLGVYTFSGLWWWHSWQYGAAMFAVAVLLLGFARVTGVAGHPLRSARVLETSAVLASVQGLAAAGGIGFLLATDKLSSVKPDWPANHVFLGGGIAICLLSFMAATTHYRLRSRA